jgi:hypothetical protein
MKFDVIVGNPPYHKSSDGYNRQESIYQYFYDSSEKISSRYCLITPARFLFNAGMTKKDWNTKMLNNPNLNVVYYNSSSKDIFKNTDIKGGVVIIKFDKYESFGAIKQFIPNDNLKKIVSYFENIEYVNLTSIMFGGRSNLKFNDKFIKDYPNSISNRLSKIREKHPNVNVLGVNEEYELKSSTFEVLYYVFKDKTPNDSNLFYKILGLDCGERCWRWIERKYMNPRYLKNNIDKYKVFVPKANGSGNFGEILSNPIIGRPFESSTPTFISIGSFDTELEAHNMLKYLKTKFLRCLLSVFKITQDNPPSKWKLIPIQDFTNNSDIDWSVSISEIDNQLYEKYKFEQDDILFIEDSIQSIS